MLSTSFIQFSAGLSSINYVAVFTNNDINYSFSFIIMFTNYCNFHIPSVVYSISLCLEMFAPRDIVIVQYCISIKCLVVCNYLAVWIL